MNQRLKPVAIFLAVGVYLIVGMIWREGGFEETWDQNSGGIVIAIVVLTALIVRALTKPNAKSDAKSGCDIREST